MAPKAPCTITKTQLSQLFSTHGSELLTINSMSKVETVIANTKNLLIKIVKKTARLNRTLVQEALSSCGFLEPRKSTITTAIMAVWKHVVAKARFSTTGAQLTPPEKAVVTGTKAHKDLPTDDVVETGTEVQVKKQKSTDKIDMKGTVPAAKVEEEEPMIAEVEETLPAKTLSSLLTFRKTWS